MKDPAFLEDAAKAKFSVGPMPGEAVQKLVSDMEGLSPALIAKIAAAFVIPGAK
jgi:hypothetical protein